MFSFEHAAMSLAPFPPAPIAATFSFSFGDSLCGTTLALRGAAAAPVKLIAALVAAVKNARRLIPVLFTVVLLYVSWTAPNQLQACETNPPRRINDWIL
jgi:hypothetical protein